MLMKRIARLLRRLISIAAIGLLSVLIWEISQIPADTNAQFHLPQVRRAIRETVSDALSSSIQVSPALAYDTYFRDGDELTIFTVDSQDRQRLMDAICRTDGWQQASIPAQAYAALAREAFWAPAAMAVPPEDVVFDAWFYRDDYLARYGEQADYTSKYADLPEVFHLSGQMRPANATFAFYDADSGVFYFYSYDT